MEVSLSTSTLANVSRPLVAELPMTGDTCDAEGFRTVKEITCCCRGSKDCCATVVIESVSVRLILALGHSTPFDSGECNVSGMLSLLTNVALDNPERYTLAPEIGADTASVRVRVLRDAG